MPKFTHTRREALPKQGNSSTRMVHPALPNRQEPDVDDLAITDAEDQVVTHLEDQAVTDSEDSCVDETESLFRPRLTFIPD